MREWPECAAIRPVTTTTRQYVRIYLSLRQRSSGSCYTHAAAAAVGNDVRYMALHLTRASVKFGALWPNDTIADSTPAHMRRNHDPSVLMDRTSIFVHIGFRNSRQTRRSANLRRLCQQRCTYKHTRARTCCASGARPLRRLSEEPNVRLN